MVVFSVTTNSLNLNVMFFYKLSANISQMVFCLSSELSRLFNFSIFMILTKCALFYLLGIVMY